jgi:hypothetical protein
MNVIRLNAGILAVAAALCLLTIVAFTWELWRYLHVWGLAVGLGVVVVAALASWFIVEIIDRRGADRGP